MPDLYTSDGSVRIRAEQPIPTSLPRTGKVFSQAVTTGWVALPNIPATQGVTVRNQGPAAIFWTFNNGDTVATGEQIPSGGVDNIAIANANLIYVSAAGAGSNVSGWAT